MVNGVRDIHSISYEYPNHSFSDPMQLLYAMKWVKPDRSNNIDNFNIFNFTNPNTTQNALQAASISNALAFGNPLQAITYGTLTQINKTVPDVFYRKNLLILMMPMTGNPDGDSMSFQEALSNDANSLHEMSIELIKQAYRRNGQSIAFDAEDIRSRSGVVASHKPHYLVPQGLPYCPKSIKSLSDLGNSELEYCAVLMRNYGHGITNNATVKLAPKGNFVLLVTSLPDMFPVKNLKSDSEFSYVYVPTFLYRQSDVANSMSGEELAANYENGSFSLNPYLRNIKTGEVMYFNSQLQALQNDQFQLIDEKKIIMSTK